VGGRGSGHGDGHGGGGELEKPTVLGLEFGDRHDCIHTDARYSYGMRSYTSKNEGTLPNI
jgi:hypothetical protein